MVRLPQDSDSYYSEGGAAADEVVTRRDAEWVSAPEQHGTGGGSAAMDVDGGAMNATNVLPMRAVGPAGGGTALLTETGDLRASELSKLKAKLAVLDQQYDALDAESDNPYSAKRSPPGGNGGGAAAPSAELVGGPVMNDQQNFPEEKAPAPARLSRQASSQDLLVEGRPLPLRKRSGDFYAEPPTVVPPPQASQQERRSSAGAVPPGPAKPGGPRPTDPAQNSASSSSAGDKNIPGGGCLPWLSDQDQASKVRRQRAQHMAAFNQRLNKIQQNQQLVPARDDTIDHGILPADGDRAVERKELMQRASEFNKRAMLEKVESAAVGATAYSSGSDGM